MSYLEKFKNVLQTKENARIERLEYDCGTVAYELKSEGYFYAWLGYKAAKLLEKETGTEIQKIEHTAIANYYPPKLTGYQIHLGDPPKFKTSTHAQRRIAAHKI